MTAFRLLYAIPVLLLCQVAVYGETEITGWGTATDPDDNCRFEVKEGILTIRVPGPVHDLSVELDRMNAPRVLGAVTGDFTVTVKVDGLFSPGLRSIEKRAAYNGAGLLLMKDEKTYIRLERGSLVKSGRQFDYANFELRENGRVVRIGQTADCSLTPDKPTWLRLERRGKEIHGAVRQGDGQWRLLKPKTVDLPAELKLGVAAVNASDRPFSPQFSELKHVKP